MKQILYSKLGYILGLLLVFPIVVFSESTNMGIFNQSFDIGSKHTKGTVEYNPQKQEYRLTGAGNQMWIKGESFYFLNKKMKGNYILQFEFEYINKTRDPKSSIGIMIRNDTSSTSPSIYGAVQGDKVAYLRNRFEKGGAIKEVKMPKKEQNTIVQLERRGTQYIFSAGVKGEDFKIVACSDSTLKIIDEALVGIYLSSHNANRKDTVVIRNVRLTVPAKAKFDRNKDTVTSNIEIMDIETGIRKIEYSSPVMIFAPNWSMDGKSLLYNGNDGLMHNYDLTSKNISVIDTKNAFKNNNDHALSWDGKTLGISNFSDPSKGRKSVVFTVPVTGGTPTQITDEKEHSYFHGFSLDGKEMLFTGERDKGNFDIYSINIDTKVETRLTNTPGLDDGSEYSPDGKYIYFNSVRSGKMQVWRMKPDGSNQERVTNDEWNNWFPHVSPNGKMIVYIAFGNDVLPGDHPLFKHVSIRLMDLETRKVTVLAHLYGGQGTINVPSWSPDSKQIAFISFTTLTPWNLKCY